MGFGNRHGELVAGGSPAFSSTLAGGNLSELKTRAWARLERAGISRAVAIMVNIRKRVMRPNEKELRYGH